MSIYSKLFPYQKQIIDKFKERDSFGLFLDMGLGKTPLACAFAEQNNCTKVIVITINSKAIEDENISGSWLNWANKSNIKYNFHNKKEKNQIFNNNENDFLLINYESLFSRKNTDKKSSLTLKENINNFIKSCKNHNVAIIVDESHKMKNLSSLQTKAIFQIKKYLLLYSKNLYTYLLTGTPFTIGYIDLYTQLKMLGYNETKNNFIENFCIKGNIPGLLGWQQPIVGYKNLDNLFNIIHKYAITVKSEDVIDLPEKIFIYHTTDKTEQFDLYTNEFYNGKKITNELLNRHIIEDKYNFNKNIANPFFRNIAYPELKYLAETNGTFWMRARQLSIGFQGNADECQWFDKSRLNQLKKFLEENEDNYIIFYNFTAELLELYNICSKLNYNIDVFCGDIKSTYFYDKYSNLSDAEKLVSKKNIILANFASGSTGMNWQNYNKCILFSLPEYQHYEQSLKRIHRLGQKSTVIYHIFYQKNWLDYSMKKALETGTQYTLEMFESDIKRVNEIFKKE